MARRQVGGAGKRAEMNPASAQRSEPPQSGASQSGEIATSLTRKLVQWPLAGCPVQVICAPAGFGKTATLAHLHRRVGANGGAGAWLTLGDGDDAAAFRSSLQGALARALGEAEDTPLEALLDRFAAQSASAIFIDDLHCASAAVRRDIAALLTQAPPTLSIALAGRDSHGLRLGRLGVSGRAETADPEMMRMPVEALAAIAPRASERELKKIIELTDGWPAAAAALARTLHAQPRGLGASAEHVVRAGLVRYVREEVAPAFSPDLVSALHMKALVGNLPPGPEATALEAAVMDGPLTGFMRRSTDGMLRLNPILAIWSRHTLAMGAASERGYAAERAARLALAAGRPAEAFEIALDAGDTELARTILVESGAVLLWITHGYETVRKIVERAGDGFVEEMPRLQLMASVLDLKRGEVARAERRFEAARRMRLDAEAKRDADIVRAALVVYGCRDISATEWRDLEDGLRAANDSAAMRSFTTSAAAILRLQAGEFAAAERVAEAAKADARFAHSHYAIMYLDFHLAAVAFARGEATSVREQVQAGLARWRAQFKSDTGASAVASALAAEMELELGRPSAARARFLPVLKRIGDLDAWFEVYAAAHETAARLDVLELGAAGAVKKLGQVAELLRARGLARVAQHVEAIAAVLIGEARLRGESAGAGADIAPAQEAKFWREREARVLARAHALLRDGAHRQAARELSAEAEFARQSGWRRAELRLRALLVAALDAAGEDKRAARSTLDALALARMTGYKRSLIDCGGPALMRRLGALGPEAAIADRKFAELILKQIERRPVTHAKAKLTAREQEVLAALEAAGSDKQIARLLGVSEHAVRFHLKNLYRKLRVHSRLDALAQARAEGRL